MTITILNVTIINHYIPLIHLNEHTFYTDFVRGKKKQNATQIEHTHKYSYCHMHAVAEIKNALEDVFKERKKVKIS